MKVMVGGTFDPLHDGHKSLLSRSFELAGRGGEVIIGLTTDQFASRKIHRVRPFDVRKKELIEYITNHDFSARWMIEPLNDQYGSALDVDFEAIVVSEETLAVAIEINKFRRERGKKKVDIHQITCVLAEDGRWISSTRIWRGEIDSHGKLIR